MQNVPFRFMGYAYSNGDILLEMDRSYRIINLDGAEKAIFGDASPLISGRDFLETLTDESRRTVERLTRPLEGHTRIGPVSLAIVGGDGEEIELIGFFSHLPYGDDHLYVALTRPSRHGCRAKTVSVADTSASQRSEAFFDQVKHVFEEGADPGDVSVTIFNSVDGPQSIADQQEIQDYLSSVSIGGNHAAALSDKRYAVVQDKENSLYDSDQMLEELGRATGIKLEAATIKADNTDGNNSDQVRAMIFGLQQFADGVDEFGVEAFKDGGAKLLADAADRVAQFRAIIERDAFSLVYQPIVNLRTGATHHFEALARFDHLGLSKSPSDTILFAERAGLIDAFDMAVLGKAFAKTREMDKSGNRYRLAVNLSGCSISKAVFVRDLLDHLRGFDGNRDFLSFEVTESSRISDIQAVSEVIKEIRALGYGVHLDDFGAGASGFQYLKRFNVDALKIDGEYVRDALKSREDRAYLRAMITLCNDLGIKTIAEWVETHDHVRLVTKLGADYGQGHYFGVPQPTMVGAGKIHMAS